MPWSNYAKDTFMFPKLSELKLFEVPALQCNIELCDKGLLSRVSRMAERQFYADDRLYLEVKTARYAMRLLCKDLHRILCGPAYGDDQSR